MSDQPSPIQPISQEQFDDVCNQAGVDPRQFDPPAPNRDIIYAWQMLNDKGVWNIIGIGTPGGLTLPLVTTAFNVAWEAFSIAQEHADKYRCECRLAAFSFDGVTAIVHPREAE